MELKKVTSPGQAGFSELRLRTALDVLLRAVDAGVFPGGVAAVGRGGNVVMEHGFGALGTEMGAPRVTLDTIYDVASLTKVVLTTTLAMILYEQGRLALDAKVRDYFPEFSGGDKEDVMVRDLLSHSSGILWWKDLYRSVKAEWKPLEVRKWYLEQICSLPLDYPPRSQSVYSDLGIIVLGGILERVSGRGLDEMARESIIDPLGMGHTCFNPPASLRQRIAPTGKSSWRDRILVGEVHDDNAAAMGGIAPHAGLFSTAHDLASFAQMMLNGGSFDGQRVVDPSTVKLFTRRVEAIPENTRALGWDTPSQQSTAGRYFSSSAYGHLGFTGTSLWIDPIQDLFVVVLANRMSSSRDQSRMNGVRASFHDAVMEALIEVPPPRTA